MSKTYYVKLENNVIKISKRKPLEADCLVLEDVTSDGKLKVGVKKIIKVSENPEDLVDEFCIKWEKNAFPSNVSQRHKRYDDLKKLLNALKEANANDYCLNLDYEVFGGVWIDTGFDFKIRLVTGSDKERIWELL